MEQSPQDDGREPVYSQEHLDEQRSIEQEVDYLSQLLQDSGVEGVENLPPGIQAILQVAERFPNAGVTDPVVADELVAALLQNHQAAEALSAEELTEMHHSISQALLDDPVAHERLVHLWNQVVERLR